MLPKSLEQKSQMIFMLMFSGIEHKHIIQAEQYKCINILPYKTILQPLKSWWDITKSKWQYSVLKQTIPSHKSCFLLSIFSKAYLVVTTC